MPAQDSKPVLLLETSDVRPFARLLRGIGFHSRACFTLQQDGFQVQVDEGRTMSALSYIPAQIFGKFELDMTSARKEKQGRQRNKEGRLLDFEGAKTGSNKGEKRNRRRSSEIAAGPAGDVADDEGSGSEEEDDTEDLADLSDGDNTPQLQFELNLHNLLSCLNVYGNATSSSSKASFTEGNTGLGGGGNNSKFVGRSNSYDSSRGGGRFGRGRNWAGGGNADDRDEEDEDSGVTAGRDQSVGGRAGNGRGGGGKEAAMCTGCLMSWKGKGWPLVLVLKDQDPSSPTTVCKIDLLEPEEMLDDSFEEIDKQFHIVMKSAWLREALSDLDPSCAKLTIKGGPKFSDDDEDEHGELPATPPAGNANARAHFNGKRKRRANDNGRGPGDQADEEDDGEEDGGHSGGRNRQKRQMLGTFKIEAEGNSGKTELDYPNERQVMDAFICTQAFEYNYAFSTFMLCQKALQASTKVSLRIDDQGFCSLQMMAPAVTVGGETLEFSGIVEFKFRPLEEDDA